MKTKLIFAIALFSFLFVNTNQSIAQEQHNHEETTIVLDNGKPWKVVDHMMSFIQNMDQDVHHFKGTDLAAYNSLASKINDNIRLLTSNCTMTGQAHDELHKWLLPYIDLTSAFSKAATVKEAAKYLEEINKSFIEFNKYFI